MILNCHSLPKKGISQINPKLNWKIRYSVINRVQRKSPSAIKGKGEETPKHVWVRSTIYIYFYQKSLFLLARPLIASTCRPSSSPEQHRTMFLSWAAVREGTTAEWGYTRVCRLQQNLVSLGIQRVSKDRINRITFFICKKKKHAHRNFRQTFNIKSNTLTESQQQDTGSTTELRRNHPAMSRKQPPINRETKNFIQSVKSRTIVHPLPQWVFQNKELVFTLWSNVFFIYLL